MILIKVFIHVSYRFHLSFREINEGLPTIDTSKTDIWDVCPANFKPRPCTMSRFRSLDGHCNNMKHSVWGASNTPFVRFLPPMYSNGKHNFVLKLVNIQDFVFVWTKTFPRKRKLFLLCIYKVNIKQNK